MSAAAHHFRRGDAEDFSERRIVTGLIVSTEYAKRIQPIWQPGFIEAPEVRKISGWCWDYFKKYNRTPDRDIEGIYMDALQNDKLSKAEAELIQVMLSRVSDDYGQGEQFNAAYLFDQTVKYFRQRRLDLHMEAIEDLKYRGEIDQAEALARSYKPPAHDEPQWRRADTIEPLPVRWLWPRILLRGEITLVAGRPKTGKSQVTMSLAAIASSGGAWPASNRESRSRDVVIMSAEDAVDYAIVPRLMANGADLSRCFILEPAADTAKARQRIEACLDELPHHGIGALVILDPITAFMAGRDSNSIADVRSALRPLGDMARERRIAMVIVHHVRKSADGDALDAIVGSGAFSAAARIIHMVLPDPNRDGRRLFLYAGGNLGAEHPGYAFQVVPETVGEGIDTSRVAWNSTPANADANEVLAAIRKARSKPRQNEAEDWLREQLRDGPKAQREIEEAAGEAGISWATVKLAKVELGIRSKKLPGRGGGWTWSLNDDDDVGQTLH
jgi:putative DNA primase/helicase